MEKMQTMSSLAEVGITEESPAEVILTTFSPSGRPHASVMGVMARGKSAVVLKVFTYTKTFQNFRRSKAAVINIVRNVELLSSIALKDLLGFDEDALEFKKSKHVNAPRLEGADAWVEVEIQRMERKKISDEIGSSEVAHITAKVKNIEILNPGVHPLRRPESFAIEAAVLATRIREALKNNRRETAKKLFLELKEYEKKCRRTTPQSGELNLIMRIIDSLKSSMGK
jgi:hypothetical protein